MFFFSLVNAGVDLSAGVGGLTLAVSLALIIGKAVGIFGSAYTFHRLGIAPLPGEMTPADLAMVGMIGSIGLTVALFISGEAFLDEGLAGQAKTGALASFGMCVICVGLSRVAPFRKPPQRASPPNASPSDLADGAKEAAAVKEVEARANAKSAKSVRFTVIDPPARRPVSPDGTRRDSIFGVATSV